MELRQLKGKDIYQITKIINKLNIKEILESLFNSGDKGIQDLGMSIVANALTVILENLNVVEDDINQLLADLTSTSVEEIEDLSFLDYTQLIEDFVMHEDFKDFFERITLRFNTVEN